MSDGYPSLTCLTQTGGLSSESEGRIADFCYPSLEVSLPFALGGDLFGGDERLVGAAQG